MDKIKINKVLQTQDPQQFQYKDGKTGTKYLFGCAIEVNGDTKDFVEIAAFAKEAADLVVEGAELDANPKEWNGVVSYTVSKPRAGGGGAWKGGGGGKGNVSSFALSYAKDVAVAHLTASGDEGAIRDDVVLGRADAYLKWLKDNA